MKRVVEQHISGPLAGLYQIVGLVAPDEPVLSELLDGRRLTLATPRCVVYSAAPEGQGAQSEPVS